MRGRIAVVWLAGALQYACSRAPGRPLEEPVVPIGGGPPPTAAVKVTVTGGLPQAPVWVQPRVPLAALSHGPPDLMLTGKLQRLDHKLDPWVTERFRFAWRDGAYVQTGHERMVDWVYHLARFDGFLARKDLTGAAREMAAPPAEGLAAYLRAHAPDSQPAAGQTWTTNGLFPPHQGMTRST